MMMLIKRGVKREKGKKALASAARRAVIKVHCAVCPSPPTWCHRSNTVGMKKASSAPKDENSPLAV